MTKDGLKLDRITAGVNVGVFKVETEWSPRSEVEPTSLPKLHERRKLLRVTLRKAREAKDERLVRHLRVQIRALDKAISELEPRFEG
jgi:hypothetical protein